MAAFRQSVKLFEELSNDLEHARSCNALADFLENGPEKEGRAQEIERLRTVAAATNRRLAQSDEYALLPSDELALDLGDEMSTAPESPFTMDSGSHASTTPDSEPPTNPNGGVTQSD